MQNQSNTQVVVPEPSPLAIQYYRTGNVLWAAGIVLGILIPALFLLTGISSRLRTLAYRVGRRWLPALMIYALLFTLAYAILTLPLAYYEGFVREHAYGLSNQSGNKWLGDWIKGTVLSGFGLALVLWIPYLLLRRSPRRWWLYAGLATLPISIFVLVVSPIWVDTLFNQFGRMKYRALEARILALAERAGIPGSRVYEI
ncbi:MAG: M48 family peptidase, partial [Gemmatimonadales bacterium]